MKIIKLSVVSLILVNLSFNVIAQEVEGATGYCNNQRTDCNTAGEDGMPTEVENGSPGSGQPGGSQSEGPGGDNSSDGESPAERARRVANEIKQCEIWSAGEFAKCLSQNTQTTSSNYAECKVKEAGWDSSGMLDRLDADCEQTQIKELGTGERVCIDDNTSNLGVCNAMT